MKEDGKESAIKGAYLSVAMKDDKELVAQILFPRSKTQSKIFFLSTLGNCTWPTCSTFTSNQICPPEPAHPCPSQIVNPAASPLYQRLWYWRGHTFQLAPSLQPHFFWHSVSSKSSQFAHHRKMPNRFDSLEIPKECAFCAFFRMLLPNIYRCSPFIISLLRTALRSAPIIDVDIP